MMLHRTDKMLGMSILASDGEIGKVKDVYFDDLHWTARYLEVDTGTWLDTRKVLISPISVVSIDWGKRSIHVLLSQQQVEQSPSFNTHKPVHRQHEIDYFNYYGYPDYWTGTLLWGATPYPFNPMVPVWPIEAIDAANTAVSAAPESHRDPHLRSIKEVMGYHLEAADGSIGHLEDFLIDERSWALRYIVIDTRNWLPGRHVVIPPQWIENIDWSTRQLRTAVARSSVEKSPKFDPDVEFTREHEEGTYTHYDRHHYW